MNVTLNFSIAATRAMVSRAVLRSTTATDPPTISGKNISATLMSKDNVVVAKIRSSDVKPGHSKHAGQHVDDRPMRNENAFGPTGRARGVDDVGDVLKIACRSITVAEVVKTFGAAARRSEVLTTSATRFGTKLLEVHARGGSDLIPVTVNKRCWQVKRFERSVPGRYVPPRVSSQRRQPCRPDDRPGIPGPAARSRHRFS